MTKGDHGVDETEHRDVRPDAEREREHGRGGEAGMLQQLAEGEFEIGRASCRERVSDTV